jgi:DNA polymerase
MGADKYEYTLAAGLMGPPVIVTSDKCRAIIKAFREKNDPYQTLWNDMEMMLVRMVEGVPRPYKLLEVTKEFSIKLPNDLYLHYPGLEGDYDPHEQRYSNFKYYSLEEQEKKAAGDTEVKGRKIYGGLLTENVVQALARIIVAEQMLVISKELRVVTMTHDEVVCIVPENQVRDAEQFMITEMRKPPVWALELPLNAAAESGVHYG